MCVAVLVLPHLTPQLPVVVRVLSHCSQPSRKFQHVPVCLGSCVGDHQAMTLIGDAKQATGEEKSG